MNGFLVSGGPPNLVGREGTRVAIGTWIQMLGVLTALVAGVLATRAREPGLHRADNELRARTEHSLMGSDRGR